MALTITPLNLVNLGSMVLTDYPFTLAGWFRVPDIPAPMSFVFIRNAENTSFHSLYYEGHVQKQVLLVSYNSTLGVTRTTASVVPGRWLHVAGVFASPSSRTVYLDGGNSSTDSTNVSLDPIVSFTLGSVSYPERIDVADFSIFQAALAEEQIQALSAGVPPVLLPQSDSLMTYHNGLSQLNHPGLGATATSASPLTVTDHPAVMLKPPVCVGKLLRYSGPYEIARGGLHSTCSSVAQYSTSAVDQSHHQPCPAGVASTRTAQTGEVFADAGC